MYQFKELLLEMSSTKPSASIEPEDSINSQESKEKMLISDKNNLIAKERTVLEKAQARFEVVQSTLDSLPKSSRCPKDVNDFGYCADVTLIFDGFPGLLTELAKLYPPVPCVYMLGSTQTNKPAKFIRDAERRDSIRPIFPITIKRTSNEDTAGWWTEIGGRDVAVTVRSPSEAEFMALVGDRFTPNCYQYHAGSTAFYDHKLATPKVRPSAAVSWLSAFDVFADGHIRGYKQKQNLKCVRKSLYYNVVLNRAEALMSPEEALTAVFVIDGAGPGPVDGDVAQGSVTLLSNEEQESFKTLIRQQIDVLPEVIAQQKSDEFAVRYWFETFFSSRGPVPADSIVTTYIQHKLAKDTGLDIKFERLDATARKARFLGGFRVPDALRADWYFPLAGNFAADETLPHLRPQDIEVDYL